MIGALRARANAFLGRGDAAVTVPPMDGALRPNQALEEAPLLRAVSAPDSLAVDGDGVLFASERTLFRIVADADADTVEASFDAPITALAVSRRWLAIGLDEGGVVLRDRAARTARRIDRLGDAPLVCPTALALTPDGDALLVAVGASRRHPSEWRHDLMSLGATGSVWRVPLGGEPPVRLADRLAWPWGLLPTPDGLIVSEGWRARLLRIDAAARPAPVLADLPGYPARLSAARDGGAWLAVAAPRSQLVEFVLREPAYRTRMMREVPEPLWVAPTLRGHRSFREPLQGGGVKMMGILKPWAPARSYGLVVRLDARMQPVASWHSRADGTRHGVTDCVEYGGALIVAAKGDDALVALDANVGAAS